MIECVILGAIHGSGSSIARRMRRDNEVQYPPPPVFGDKRAIECAKHQTRDREKVERGDYLAVVVDDGQPASRLAPIAVSLQPPHISRHMCAPPRVAR